MADAEGIVFIWESRVQIWERIFWIHTVEGRDGLIGWSTQSLDSHAGGRCVIVGTEWSVCHVAVFDWKQNPS